MYLRSSRRPLIVLVELSLAINAILAIGVLQFQGRLDTANRRIDRLHATKADSADLTRLENRMRVCLGEIADENGGPEGTQRSCVER